MRKRVKESVCERERERGHVCEKERVKERVWERERECSLQSKEAKKQKTYTSFVSIMRLSAYFKTTQGVLIKFLHKVFSQYEVQQK